jgi:hypothetical protein
MTIVRPSICQTPDGLFLATVQVDALGLGSGTRNRASRCDTPEAAHEFIELALGALKRADPDLVIEVEDIGYADMDTAFAALKSLGIAPCRETMR